ncbi:hypothetical protein [Phytohabitans aurantiacus]|uniref:DNA-binding protein n=1 Tax=Phytohabitans aurantiacus TaxID=3016789 RepID=A0ABQ5R3N4_9ACTN|nr:hypothetical protein [Phytohabitans aurantiacus]GLI00928.1 hypothetical protein Pa4123_62040 [Phytohabitans aurantiacus]
MSYGEQLENAAAALARAYVALRDSEPDPDARASAALARARLYRSLERQAVVLGSLHASDLAAEADLPRQYESLLAKRRPIAVLTIGLRHAAASTIAANDVIRIDPPTAGAVAVALREAHQALRAAGDILISNTGAQTAPGERHQPLTADGIALLAGAGRSDNLAALASLAAAASEIDVRLARWMWPEDAPTGLRSLLAAAEEDAWQTKSSPLHDTAVLLAAGGDPQRAPILGMAPAPPVDDPQRWSHPSSAHDCVQAIDAARSWLVRRGDELTVDQLADAARAALAITRYLGYLYTHLGSGGEELPMAVDAAARPWRGALQAVAELRSPIPDHGDRGTLSTAIAGAAAWLRGQLRPDGQWRSRESWMANPTDRVAWWNTAGQITARMPDLADLLHQAVDVSRARGGVLAMTVQVGARSVHWRPALAEHRSYRALAKALANAAKHGRVLAAVVGVQPRPGLEAARTAHRAASALPAKPAELAGQWYPQQAGMAEPTAPAGRPRSPGTPGQGRTR